MSNIDFFLQGLQPAAGVLGGLCAPASGLLLPLQTLPLMLLCLLLISFYRGSNQRLEFLGDSVLQLVVSSYLYKHFPLAMSIVDFFLQGLQPVAGVLGGLCAPAMSPPTSTNTSPNVAISFYRGSNQRLEFLGDSVLQLVVSSYLYKHFPDHHEGHLSVSLYHDFPVLVCLFGYRTRKSIDFFFFCFCFY